MRVIDRPQGAPPVDETDREMARTLLGGKNSRAKRRRKRERFYQKGWFVVSGLIALLGALGFALFLVLGPPGPDKLYEQAKVLMESSNHDDHSTALDGPIALFLKHHGNRPGKQLEDIQHWAAAVPIEQCEDLMEGYLKKKGSAIKYQVQNDTEEAAFKALDQELEGDLSDAKKGWENIQKAHGDDRWGVTAKRRLGLIAAAEDQEKVWDKELNENMLYYGQEPDWDEKDRKAFRAYRAEHFGDVYGEKNDEDIDLAHTLYAKLVKENFQKTLMRQPTALLAAKKSRTLKPPVKESAEVDAQRKEAVTRALLASRNLIRKDGRRARLIAMNIVAVYGDSQFPDLVPLVDEAKAMAEQLK
jgi:hypothetical protein